MERGLFSSEILEVISRNIKIFIITFLFIFLGMAWKITAPPQEYRAVSYFRYMGIEPGEITVKKDNNGTITLVKYELGKENLDIQTLFKSSEFNEIKRVNRVKLTFDSGNGNYVLEVIGKDREEIIKISGEYLEKFLEKNREFLTNKISQEIGKEQKEKLIFELENEGRSFPVMIKSQKAEEIESRKGIFLFFAIFTAIFLGVVGAFIAQILREIREKV
ncbi:MAG: hypothetical protein ACRCTS_09920 [Fusobacteriaceae bacterium]